jgi:sugar lactone lactonase YvrE
MVRIARITLGTLALGALLVLSGCPSPFLTAIQAKIAQFPFTATAYNFVRQWGNPNPEYSFGSSVVKVDTAGYFYVADSTYRIRKFSPAGALQKTYDIGAVTGIGGSVYDLAFDPSGNMYVATSSSSTPILKYDVSGNVLSWTPGTTISTARGVAVDSSGNVYVLDSGVSKVLKFTSTGASLTSWDGTGNGSGGAAFSGPTGIAIDGYTYVNVCDNGTSGRVQYYSSTGTYYGKWTVTFNNPTAIACNTSTPPTFYVANSGASNVLQVPYGGASSVIFASGFTSVSGVAVDGSGNVYAADLPVTNNLYNGLGRIQKFNSSKALVASWGGIALTGNGQFTVPAGVAFDASGNLYVSEYGGQRIQKFSSSGGYLGQWSDPNYKPWLGSIAINSSGTIYAPNYTNHYVQVLDSSLNPVTTMGSGTLQSPASVALDSSGNIYVADTGLMQIVIYDSNGYTTHVPQTIGTTGTADGNLEYPVGVAVDSQGNVYVADFAIFGQPHMIQKFNKNGTFVKAWGASGTGDGQLQLPVGIAVDKYDHVYVADFVSRRIQKFDSDGNFMAKWGGVGVGNGTFGWPFDVAVDSSGNLAITDATTNLVQILSPAP